MEEMPGRHSEKIKENFRKFSFQKPVFFLAVSLVFLRILKLLFAVNFLRLFFNKYILVLALFLVWMAAFDRNDFASQQRSKEHLQELRQSIDYLHAEIDRMDSERVALMQNPEALEKFAREKYRMKRDGEDLYVLQP